MDSRIERDLMYQNLTDPTPKIIEKLFELEDRISGVSLSGDKDFRGDNKTSAPVVNILSTKPDKQGIFVKQQAEGPVTTHALTAFQASTSGAASAINAVSTNETFSAMQVTGREVDTGTIKVAHIGKADGSDAGAAGLSIDLKTAGTAAQGIFITGTQGPTTGNLLTIRNNNREDLVLKGNGKLGLGIPIGGNPAGVLELVQQDDTTPGLVIRARATGENMIELRRADDGAIRTRFTRGCQLVTYETSYFAGNGIMVGSSSASFGGGSGGMIGMINATSTPSSNPSGGIVLYVENDQLKYKKPDGTVVTLDVGL
ncbi:hypothetical protein P59_105 [Bacillus phage P59]|nr:hypothetical protein P59_105 [Bacillus phage P59]